MTPRDSEKSLAGSLVRSAHEYDNVVVRVRPCPECGHDTEHKDQVCYCEVPGCDCDRTSVRGFWKKIPITPAPSRAKTLSPDDSVRVGTLCFNLAHEIEALFGLVGVRAMKAWCREKLPYGAFERGHFDAETDYCQAKHPQNGHRCDRRPHSGELHRNAVLGESWSSEPATSPLSSPEVSA